MGVSGVQPRAFDRFGSERCSVGVINTLVWNFALRHVQANVDFPVSSSVQLLSVADVDSPVSSFNRSIRGE